MTTAIERVLAGIALIDEDPNIIGDWQAEVREAIESGTLSMADYCGCVIGHVYCPRTEAHRFGRLAYENALYQLGITSDEAARYGFDIEPFDNAERVTYTDLLHAWAELLGAHVPGDIDDDYDYIDECEEDVDVSERYL